MGGRRPALRGALEDLRRSLATRPPRCRSAVADAADETSLRALCDSTRVIASTVGPYALYGEPLVKACAVSGTDYCDLSGEVQWIRRMMQRYEATARESGARMVHCCGFDSIPSDLGVTSAALRRWKRLDVRNAGSKCASGYARVSPAAKLRASG
jgi:short subunit dehydrogenase-like uncharacterized protein